MLKKCNRYTLIAVLCSLVLLNHSYRAKPVDNTTTVGSITARCNFQTCAVTAVYSNDDDGDNSALIEWKLSTDANYHAAYTPYIDRRASIGATNPNPNYKHANVPVWLVGGTSAANKCYDFRVTWADSDGVSGGTTASTNACTPTYTPPHTGTSYSISDNSTLNTKLGNIIAGETIDLAAGTYNAFTLSRSGNSSQYIVIQGPTSGTPATISGAGVNQNISIQADYVLLRYLTLSDSDLSGIAIGAHNHIYVDHVTIQGVLKDCVNQTIGGDGVVNSPWYGASGIGINDGAAQIYLTNNTITGHANLSGCVQSTPFYGPGTGIAFCAVTDLVAEGNTVTGKFRDGLSSDNSTCANENIEYYNNTLSGWVDDGLEMKGTAINGRIWSNAITADDGTTCISIETTTADTSEGPSYIVRNHCDYSNTTYVSAVLKDGGQPIFVFHNSFRITVGGSVAGCSCFSGEPEYSRNNAVKLLASYTEGGYGDYDYDIVNTGGTFMYNWLVTPPSTYMSYSTWSDFHTAFPSKMGNPSGHVTDDPSFVDAALTINSSSPAYNAGVDLPNINSQDGPWGYSGSKPDIGYYEVGGFTYVDPNPPTNNKKGTRLRIIR